MEVIPGSQKAEYETSTAITYLGELIHAMRLAFLSDSNGSI